MGRASDQFEAQLASPHELEGEAVNAHAVASCCFFGAQVVKQVTVTLNHVFWFLFGRLAV